MYYIQNRDGDYWNNHIGWVDKDSATIFTKDEMASLSLPMGGKWVKNV